MYFNSKTSDNLNWRKSGCVKVLKKLEKITPKTTIPYANFWRWILSYFIPTVEKSISVWDELQKGYERFFLDIERWSTTRKC